MDWKEIYKNLDPMEPLKPGDPRLEKDIFKNYINNVAQLILLGKNTNQKVLFSGNIGCGKSTFLNLLAEHPEIKKEFFIVKYSLKDILDPNDISHIDILLSIALQTFETLAQSNKKIVSKSLIENVKNLALEIEGLLVREEETEKSQSLSAQAEGGLTLPQLLQWIKAGLFARFQLEKETRETIRKYFRPRMTEFLNAVNDILLHVSAGLKDLELLILIDDTDKIPPENALDIFLGNGQHFSKLQSNLLFVVDTSLSCFPKYSIIVNQIGKEEFFPALKLIEKNGEESEASRKNKQLLVQLISKRIPDEFITDDAKNEAIEMSGGVVRELIRILQEAVFRAQGRINKDHVSYAVISIRNKYTLFGKHVAVLKNIKESPDWLQTTTEDVDSLEPIIRELLWMPALFQYRNGEDKWYRPYPIFIEWLNNLKIS